MQGVDSFFIEGYYLVLISSEFALNRRFLELLFANQEFICTSLSSQLRIPYLLQVSYDKSEVSVLSLLPQPRYRYLNSKVGNLKTKMKTALKVATHLMHYIKMLMQVVYSIIDITNPA